MTFLARIPPEVCLEDTFFFLHLKTLQRTEVMTNMMIILMYCSVYIHN